MIQYNGKIDINFKENEEVLWAGCRVYLKKIQYGVS